MVREAISNKAEFALLCILFDWIKELFLANFQLGISPSRDLDNHVQDGLALISKEWDIMPRRDWLAWLTFEPRTPFWIVEGHTINTIILNSNPFQPCYSPSVLGAPTCLVLNSLIVLLERCRACWDSLRIGMDMQSESKGEEVLKKTGPDGLSTERLAWTSTRGNVSLKLSYSQAEATDPRLLTVPRKWTSRGSYHLSQVY